MSKYYIAYGSNLSVKQVAQRCPDAKVVGQAVLEGWRLDFCRYATIQPKEGRNTPVLVWEISQRDEQNLDRYEGFPRLYRKEELTVELLREGENPRTVTAMVYIMNDPSAWAAPSISYFRVLWDAYKEFHFPRHILSGALKRCVGVEFAEHIIAAVDKG